jgi:membrane fusion protein (multidrug efflux system)
MSTRKIIVSAVGIVLILVAAGTIASTISGSRVDPPEIEMEAPVKRVKGRTIVNSDITSQIDLTGRLMAPDRIEIFSEVGGTLKASSSRFKEGNYFAKGSPLVSIDATEQQLNLLAQKSSLMNQITLMLPDLKVDYPESFTNWEQYLAQLDPEQGLKPLPEPVNQKERYYVSAKNLYNLYYTIKSQEERLKKYTIYAPFSGRVSESNITAGTLVRVGQKLGEFFNPNNYELEAAVNLDDLDFVRIGNKVQLSADGFEQTWEGSVRRISDIVDPNTQTAKVFISVRGKELREGMYLSATIQGRPLEQVVEIPRKLLQSGEQVYIVEDSSLKLHPIELAQLKPQSVVVKGIPDNTILLDEVVIGAYEGMQVNTY